MLKLISATPSLYTRKLLIVLCEKSIPVELITEVPWDSTTKTSKHNPPEKLPVLILYIGSLINFLNTSRLNFLERSLCLLNI
jgi:glutathione S-transferase